MGCIIKNGLLITFNENDEIFDRGCVAIEGDEIIDYGKEDEILEKYKYYPTLDANGRVIMPGLINTHHHLYSTFSCGLSVKVSRNFVEILKNLWWKLDNALDSEEAIYFSALISLLRCIKAGVTTIIDHHASYGYIRGSLRKIRDALKTAGIRGCLCYEVSDRWGEEKTEVAIEENIEFIRECKESNDESISALFGLHASMTLSEKTLEKVSSSNGGFHIHVAEDIIDVEDSIKKYGKRVIERLFEHKILGEKTICAHGIHINEKEMEILAETKTALIHNPQSNMNNAVGCADIPKALQKNVLIGLGTDGMTSSMFDEVRVVPLIHRNEKKDPNVMFLEGFNILTKNNPLIASRYFKKGVGRIAKGSYADIIVVDYYPSTPINKNNLAGHFIFGICNSRVSDVITGGDIVMRNFNILKIDEEEVSKEALKISKIVQDKFYEK